jgi:hypothetical protein
VTFPQVTTQENKFVVIEFMKEVRGATFEMNIALVYESVEIIFKPSSRVFLASNQYTLKVANFGYPSCSKMSSN